MRLIFPFSGAELACFLLPCYSGGMNTLMTQMVQELPLAPLDLVKQRAIALRPDKTEDAFYAERRFIKTEFYTALRVAHRNRARHSIRLVNAWTNGFMARPELFNAAAADGLNGFTDRLLAASPGIHPLTLCFNMSASSVATWPEANLARVVASPRLGEAFVQTVAEYNVPFDYFERLWQVHEEAVSGYNASAFLSRLAPDTMRRILAQLCMVRAPRRDSLAWASLCEEGPNGFDKEALIDAIPFLAAAGCSPAEAIRLRGLGVRDPKLIARIVADDIPDEYVYSMVNKNSSMGLVAA